MRTISETRSELARQTLQHAMSVMADAGFKITGPIKVLVEPKLPFMGYTKPEVNGFRIVASGMATESGMLEGLLLHELSHVYRMQSKHPSHDGQLIEEVINALGMRALSPEYKIKIIRDLVNDIEDLYADDIAVKAMIEGQVVSSNQLTEFLQGWVKDTPVKSRDRLRDSWVNTSIMAKNARAIGQMMRHGIVDHDGIAANLNEKFLLQLPPEKSRRFDYFKNLLANLKENSGREEYRRFLDDYLRSFVDLAEA